MRVSFAFFAASLRSVAAALAFLVAAALTADALRFLAAAFAFLVAAALFAVAVRFRVAAAFFAAALRSAAFFMARSIAERHGDNRGCFDASLNSLIAGKFRVQAAIQAKIQPKIAMRIDGDRRSHAGFTFGQCMEQFRILFRNRDDGVFLAFYYGVTANVTEAIFAFEHWNRE